MARWAAALAALLLLAPLLAESQAASASTTAPGSEFTVFGYLPEYRTANFDYEGAFQTGLTHLIYFSVEVCSDEHLDCACVQFGVHPLSPRACAQHACTHP